MMSSLSPDASEITALASETHFNEIQFATPPSRDALETLEKEILKKRQDFEVRFYGFYRSVCDLGFLQFIPSVSKLVVNCLSGPIENVERIGDLQRLTSLKVGITQLRDFSFLERLPPLLDTLYLEEAQSKKLSLKAIVRFSRLRRLYIERHHKDLESIGTLPNLQSLVLRSITVPSLSFLTPLSSLRVLNLKLGGTTKLDELSELLNLRELEMWQVRKLEDIRVVASIPKLETLKLQDLPNVTKVPSLASCSSLKTVFVKHLKNLEDLSSIAEAPHLEHFALTGSSKCLPEAFMPFVNHQTLKDIWVGLGSAKRNRAVHEMFAGSRIELKPPLASADVESKN
jgi:Leucine-rich repeat (LRR) protein